MEIQIPVDVIIPSDPITYSNESFLLVNSQCPYTTVLNEVEICDNQASAQPSLLIDSRAIDSIIDSR